MTENLIFESGLRSKTFEFKINDFNFLTTWEDTPVHETVRFVAKSEPDLWRMAEEHALRLSQQQDREPYGVEVRFNQVDGFQGYYLNSRRIHASI